jgi:hypothetical protein
VFQLRHLRKDHFTLQHFWKKFDEENSSRKLRAPVTSTEVAKSKSVARSGPTRRSSFGRIVPANPLLAVRPSSSTIRYAVPL